MQALDDVLASLRIRSVINSRCELGAPWGIRFPAEAGAAKFHFVVEGGGLLDAPGHRGTALRAGDFVMILGSEHSVRDAADSPTPGVEELFAAQGQTCGSGLTHRLGGPGNPTTVISGKCLLDSPATNPLLRALPAVILVRGDQGCAVEWLEHTLGFMACEAASGRPGAQAVLDRLSDILFVQAIRAYVKAEPESAGWIQAVRDEQIGQALALIHREPALPWTVASLAERVAMSRSAFAERFGRLAGEAPMQYLTRWRMHRAAEMLREGRESVGTVALAVGYESEAAFNKAFKRLHGRPPGEFRKAYV
jgi:AraC-like DNA-binding protein